MFRPGILPAWPALDELGWLQFERLCELVLEADAGVDPRAGRAPPTICAGRLPRAADDRRADARAAGAAPLRVAARGRASPMPGGARQEPATSARDVREPRRGRRRRRLRRARAARRDPPPPDLRLRMPSLLSLDVAPPDPAALERSTIDVDAARELARVFVSTPAWHQRRRRPARAPLPRPHRAARDGQDGDRAHARPGAADRGLGGARVHAPGAGRGALRPRAPAAVHRRRRVRLDRVPAGRRRALGDRPRPDPARHRREALARVDLAPGAAACRPAPAAPRAWRRALPAAGRRCRSTRRRSARRRRR